MYSLYDLCLNEILLETVCSTGKISYVLLWMTLPQPVRSRHTEGQFCIGTNSFLKVRFTVCSLCQLSLSVSANISGEWSSLVSTEDGVCNFLKPMVSYLQYRSTKALCDRADGPKSCYCFLWPQLLPPPSPHTLSLSNVKGLIHVDFLHSSGKMLSLNQEKRNSKPEGK